MNIREQLALFPDLTLTLVEFLIVVMVCTIIVLLCTGAI